MADLLQGQGWANFKKRVDDNLVGARAMMRTQFMIGSNLPYASHWIDQGWRNDPRRGYLEVRYRHPGYTDFLQNPSGGYGGVVRRRRPSEATPVGTVFSAAIMLQYADDIAQEMRDTLQTKVYDVAVPTTSGGRPKWYRTRDLYNSIRVYRV